MRFSGQSIHPTPGRRAAVQARLSSRLTLSTTLSAQGTGDAWQASQTEGRHSSSRALPL